MSQLPDKLWLRRGEVRDFLGLSEEALTKIITAKVLKPKFFPGMKRAYFLREDVLKVKPEESLTGKGKGR